LTAKDYYYGGEYVNENTRIAIRMAYGRPAKKASPDRPSLVLDRRILYIGMPLVPSTTELLISELLWLNYYQQDNPIYVYINSTESQTPDGQAVGFETRPTLCWTPWHTSDRKSIQSLWPRHLATRH